MDSRRDGKPTIHQNAYADAQGVLGALIGMAREHGYYGDAAVAYITGTIEYTLEGMASPKSFVRIFEKIKDVDSGEGCS